MPSSTNVWEREFQAHRGHQSFKTRSWPYTLEVGFSCACCGEEDEWRIGLSALKALLPGARDRFLRLVHHHNQAGTKKRRREATLANIKAKALLHHNLTREQRWDLRASKSFTIVGKDGRTYRITEGTASNVYLLENGVETKRLCVVAKDVDLPVYDLMLAQKLMLESIPDAFWKIAVVSDLIPVPRLRAAG